MPEPDPSAAIRTPTGAMSPFGGLPGDAPPFPVPDHTLIRRIGRGAYGEVWLARNTLGTWRAVKFVRRRSFDDDKPFEREFAGIQRFEPISRSHESQLNILHVGRAEDGFYYVMELADDMSGAQASGGLSVIGGTNVGGTSSASPHLESRSSASLRSLVGGASYTSPQPAEPESGPQGTRPPAGESMGTRITRPSETGPSETGRPSESRSSECKENWLNPDTYTPRNLRSELHFRGRLPVAECLRLGLALTTALEHLHKHGLVHRDIKPSNIVFVNGIPKLADIGLVARAEATISFVGTEGFLPPEGPGTRQADIFSLGKVLYEISTGHDRNQFPELPTNIVELPDRAELSELNEVLLKACHRDPRERYQTAAEMHADLALLESGRSVVRLRGIERKLRFVQRAGVIVTGIAVLAAGLYFWQARQAQEFRRLARENDRARRLALDNLYLADIRAAYHDWESGQIAKTLELLRQHIPQGTEPDRRGWEWYYLLSLCHREERTLKADPSGVRAVSCDPSGRRFASGGLDHTVRVWDAESGACLAELKGHEDYVTCVAWSPDGARLVSGAYDGTVILWDAERFQKLFVRDAYQAVWSLAWSPDGKRFAVGGADRVTEYTNGLVTIWDANSAQRLHDLKSNVGVIWSLAWHPGGKLLAAGENYRGQMQIWDAESGQLRRTIQAHDHSVSSLAWRPDGRQLASASYDQRIRIWDAETWEPVTAIDPAHRGLVGTLDWSPDGERLISGGQGRFIKIWDARTGAMLNALRGHQGSVRSIAWWPGHGRIISGSADGTLKIWNPESEQVARTIAGAGVCAWSPDGAKLALGGSRGDTNGGVVQILDVATWRTRFTVPGITKHFPHGLAWSSDGRLLAATYLAGQVQVWDPAPCQEILLLPEAHEGEEVRTVAWSPDGRLLATAGHDGAVRLWNIETKANVLTFLEHSNAVHSAVWSPDGRQIASKDLSPGAVLIWEAQTGKVKLRLQCPGGFNPGNQYVVSWSPEGDKLAAGSGDGTIMVWETASGRVLQALKGHTSVVRSVHWSPDGRRLVSSAEDRTIRIWDPQSGRELLVLPHPDNTYPNVAWSPSGRMICASGQSALIYDATLGYELAPQLTQSTTNR